MSPKTEEPRVATPSLDVPAEEVPETQLLSAQILTAKARIAARTALEETKRAVRENLWTMRCSRNRDHMGAFFLVDPLKKGGEPLGPGSWFSIDHEAGRPYLKHYILCQECAAAGEGQPEHLSLRPVPLQSGSFGFVLPSDYKTYIRLVPKTDVREMLEEAKAPLQEVKDMETIGGADAS